MFHLNVRLSHKIAAIGVCGIAGLLIVGAAYGIGDATQARYESVNAEALSTYRLADMIMIELLEARRSEKDFIIRSDEKYAARQVELAKSITGNLDALKARLQAGEQQELAQKTDGVRAGFETYAKNFAALADARRKLGLDENSGLEGVLRGSVHNIEDKLKEFDEPKLNADMLTLRRHEKDFMLRRDVKYADQLKASAGQFAATLSHTNLPAAAKDDISQKLANYQKDFTSWVTTAQTVVGFQKAMSEAYASIEPQIEAMMQGISKIRNDAQAARDAVQAATRLQIEIAIVTITLLVGVLAFFIGRAVSKPLGAMTSTMQTLAAGNLEVTIPGSDRTDEIGEMAHAVEVFKVNAIERIRLESEQKQAELRMAAQRKVDMHKLADDFQAAVGTIIDTVSSASTELEAAAGTLTQTADTTQKLSTTVAAASEQASSNVQSVAAASEQLSGSVNEIARQVQEATRIANNAVQQAQKTDARIAQLSQAAARIGDVVKLITGVAEQTNLLALNATIEAARAGDAGKGFAVVAHEVKALAAQTAKATDEISTQIAGMQSATQDSVAAIKEIGDTIGRISEISTTVAAAVEEQGAATQEISRNVQQAAQGTSEVAANITTVSRGANETGSASTQVLSSAQSLSHESNHLKLEVDKFLNTVRAA